MARTYEECSDVVREILDDLLRTTHKRLLDAGVTFHLAYTWPQLMHQGYPAGAVVEIVSLKLRSRGQADAAVTIDADSWEEQSEDERRGLLDHELTHLLVVIDKDTGKPKLDAAGRPKLKMRKHDYFLGGFTEVVERHKIAAPEARGYRAINRDWGQTLLPWG